MSTVIELLEQKTDDELRELTAHTVPAIAEAAKAVLEVRAPKQERGCSCCGAGVRQWR